MATKGALTGNHPPEKHTRIILNIPQKQHRALKLAAAKNGSSMTAIILQALKERGIK